MDDDNRTPLVACVADHNRAAARACGGASSSNDVVQNLNHSAQLSVARRQSTARTGRDAHARARTHRTHRTHRTRERDLEVTIQRASPHGVVVVVALARDVDR